MGRLREQLGGLPRPPPPVHRVAIPFESPDTSSGPAADDASDDASPARKENTPPQRPAKGPALAAARVRERAKLKADAASAAAKAEAAAAAREAAQPSAAERRASAREKSRAEFRAKIAADRRGRSPSKKDERVEVLAGPIPPLSPARPPVVAPVSPGTTTGGRAGDSGGIGPARTSTLSSFFDGDRPRRSAAILARNSARDFSRAEARRSCLLYTSPSPRDKRQSRMPSSA